MAPTDRCDEILRIIDAVLEEAEAVSSPGPSALPAAMTLSVLSK